MSKQITTSNNSLFSTNDELLINNVKFPALEQYLEHHVQLENAYKEWLAKEKLGKNICYIDLTFQIPGKSLTTLFLSPIEKNIEVYTEILKDFIIDEHTLYPHRSFKKGVKSYLNNGFREILQRDENEEDYECSESFFLHEIRGGQGKIISDYKSENNLEFHAAVIPLAEFYKIAEEKNQDYFKIIQAKEIKDIWTKWVELHEGLEKKKLCLTSNSGGELNWITVVPLGIKTENNEYRPVGSIFLGMDNNCSRDEVIYFIRSLIILILSSSQRYYEKIAKRNSIKSAVSAIMSRNMSHNLGSHVLSNLKGELEEIGKLFKDDHDDKGCLPFKSENLFGLKWFINYLQERQDFIATIGGFENQTFMPVNFKTFVFDGLLPDHQYQRHSTSTNLNAHKNYLLEYIVKSENIQRNQIVIKYKDFVSSVHNTASEKDYNELTKLNVCFPGGIVGRQAFFSIFENIIRNAAKHSEIKDKLEITIDTPDKGNYDTNEYIRFTLTDNLRTFNDAETILKKALNEPIFNESQEKQGNKGIKEMKISAAWLRGIRLEDIDSYSEEKDDGFIKQPKILDLNKSDDSIQYVFYLLKPKEILIYITDSEINDLKLTEDEKKSFNEHGIDVISKEFFQGRDKYNLRHSLFVFHKESEFENDKNIEKYFNQRRLKLTAKSLIEILNMHRSNPQNLNAAFWKVYLELEHKAMPFIEIRPSGIDNDNKFERFKVIPNAKGYTDDADTKILFKHHNDAEYEFKKFHKDYPDLFGNLRFLEGISGGNSTELLTTRIEKSEMLYYKLLQSCLTDVVIIDERLWNNNSKIDITTLTNIIDKKVPLFNQEILNEINQIQDASDWANKIIKKLNINSNKDILEDLIYSYHDRHTDDFLNFIIDEILPVQTVQYQLKDCKVQNEYKYLLYRKKNIEVLNILFGTEGQHEFELINLNLEKININNLKQNLSLNGQYKIISIHQGIIDKIQNHLTNKQKNQDANTPLNSNALDILNQAIPDDFIKIIHSGRGKPSVEIPKGFHFIPYASVESAFYDCKFSLTELLFNAKTELS